MEIVEHPHRRGGGGGRFAFAAHDLAPGFGIIDGPCESSRVSSPRAPLLSQPTAALLQHRYEPARYIDSLVHAEPHFGPRID